MGRVRFEGRARRKVGVEGVQEALVPVWSGKGGGRGGWGMACEVMRQHQKAVDRKLQDGTLVLGTNEIERKATHVHARDVSRTRALRNTRSSSLPLYLHPIRRPAISLSLSAALRAYTSGSRVSFPFMGKYCCCFLKNATAHAATKPRRDCLGGYIRV